jgi:uncharacterized protein YndB with AHSA1/START domain
MRCNGAAGEDDCRWSWFGGSEEMVTLIVRKTICASAERLFAAWTDPEELKVWWGPEGVKCVDAEVDLRVGGRYRIANQFPDGKIVWITGIFEAIERPRKLVYSWAIEPEMDGAERVTVQFEASGNDTEVIVTHERIVNEQLRDIHQQGWLGCLAGLAKLGDGA